MRTFIVICFIAAACADQLGYNYHPVQHSPGGLSFTPGSGYVSNGPSGGSLGLGNLGSHGIGGLGVGSGIQGGNGDVGVGVGIGSGIASGIGAGIGGGIGGGIGAGVGVGGPGLGGSVENGPSYEAPIELEKEFYTFSAPENEFDDGNAAQRITGSVKKGIRVIFIKGPESNGLEHAALSLAKHVAEQKTAIYVLNKQADIGDLAHKLNSISTNINNKPEVHFVKYRTHEDAANAQKAIQSQYDSLGGTSQSHNGGVAPVINFASQAPAHVAPAQAPGNSYLPSSVLRS